LYVFVVQILGHLLEIDDLLGGALLTLCGGRIHEGPMRAFALFSLGCLPRSVLRLLGRLPRSDFLNFFRRKARNQISLPLLAEPISD
jgi:hypothetical protein